MVFTVFGQLTSCEINVVEMADGKKSSNWTSFLITLAFFCAGLCLLALGLTGKCPTEPALPVWMVVAGATLTGLTTLSLTWHLLVFCQCVKASRPHDCVGRTVCALACTCACGTLAVILLLVWLAVWIAGTYFVVVAIREMRTAQVENIYDREKECDLSAVLVSGLSVIFTWVMILVAAIAGACALCQNSRDFTGSRSEKQAQNNIRPSAVWTGPKSQPTPQQHGPLYDRVPIEDPKALSESRQTHQQHTNLYDTVPVEDPKGLSESRQTDQQQDHLYDRVPVERHEC